MKLHTSFSKKLGFSRKLGHVALSLAALGAIETTYFSLGGTVSKSIFLEDAAADCGGGGSPWPPTEAYQLLSAEPSQQPTVKPPFSDYKSDDIEEAAWAKYENDALGAYIQGLMNEAYKKMPSEEREKFTAQADAIYAFTDVVAHPGYLKPGTPLLGGKVERKNGYASYGRIRFDDKLPVLIEEMNDSGNNGELLFAAGLVRLNKQILDLDQAIAVARRTTDVEPKDLVKSRQLLLNYAQEYTAVYLNTYTGSSGISAAGIISSVATKMPFQSYTRDYGYSLYGPFAKAYPALAAFISASNDDSRVMQTKFVRSRATASQILNLTNTLSQIRGCLQ